MADFDGDHDLDIISAGILDFASFEGWSMGKVRNASPTFAFVFFLIILFLSKKMFVVR